MSSVASIAVALLFFNVTRLRLSSVAWKPRPESILTRSSLKLPVAMLLSPAKSSSSPPTPTKTSTEVAPLKAPVPSVTATAWYSVSASAPTPPATLSAPSSVTMPSCTLKLPLATRAPNALRTVLPAMLINSPFSPSKLNSGPSAAGMTGMPITLPPALKSRTVLGFPVSLV